MERLKSIYKGIKTRCYNKNSVKYKNYGARGVVMCEKWKNDFKCFETWALSNGYADNLTIDRIDVNGIYEPNNCRWVTLHEQARNRTDNVYVFL